MKVHQKRPLLARAIVALLATVLAFIGTMIAYFIAKAMGADQLANGIAIIFPLSSAWTSAALVQKLKA